MNDEEQLRYTELQFYFLIKKLYKLIPDITELLFFLDCIKIYNKYNAIIIKSLVIKVLEDTALTPNPIEAVIILHKANVPIRKICKLLRIHNDRFYNLTEMYKEDPYPIHFKTDPISIQEMKKVLDAFKKLNDIGAVLL